MMSTVLIMREANWRVANDAKARAEEAYLNSMNPDAEPGSWPDREHLNTLWIAIIEAKRIEAEAYEAYRVTREFVEARNNDN